MSSKVPGEMACSLFHSTIEAFYISLMVLPGVHTNDVNLSCEAFVENAYSSCTCAVNKDSVSAVGKCLYTVGYVVLELSSDVQQRSCKFSDVFKGLKQPTKIGFSSCRLVHDGFPNNIYTMRVSLLTRKSDFSENSTAFVCNLNCQPVNLSHPLDYFPRSRKIPVVFSPNCTPGMFGELCNESCDPLCVNGVCDRESGNCTKNPKPEESSKLALALAIGVPALAGAVGFLSWFCGRCTAVLDLIQSILPEREVSGSSSDSESSSQEGKPTIKAPATQLPPPAPIPVVVVDETTSGVSSLSQTSYESSTSGSSSGVSIATSVASVPVAKREDSTMPIKPSS